MKRRIVLLSLLFFFFAFREAGRAVLEQLKTGSEETEVSGAAYYLTDGAGQTVDAFEKADHEYILFATDAAELGELTIHYGGEVTEISAGILNTLKKEIRVAAVNNSTLTVTRKDGTKDSVLIRKSELPTVSITLGEGKSLRDLHADKDVKIGNTAVVVTEGGAVQTSAEDAQIKGRGNTSWKYYEKKGYQLRFSEKTDLLGMGSAKKWILLANASDSSMMKNAAAFDLARAIGLPGIPEYRFADLFINGEYRGLYMVCEKVEIGKERLDLSENGVLAELDEEFYDEEELWFEDAVTGRHYTEKDAEEALAETLFAQFEASMNIFLENALRADSASFAKVEETIDLDSFARVYLLEEFLANNECTVTSLFFWQDGGKLHAGPVWDFDTCLDGNSGFSPDDRYVYNLEHFNALLKSEDFYRLARQIYDGERPVFEAIAEGMEERRALLRLSAEMDDLRWDTYAADGEDRKGNRVFSSFDAAVDHAEDWIGLRTKAFPALLARQVRVRTEDGMLRIAFDDPASPSAEIRCAVWNGEGRENGVEWLDLSTDANGHMETELALDAFRGDGMVNVHCYVGGELAGWAAFTPPEG